MKLTDKEMKNVFTDMWERQRAGESNSPEADELRIYHCDDCDLIHLYMIDKHENVLAELAFEPETALSIARRIEQAADRALGVT